MNFEKNLESLREFIDKEKLDFFLINSTDEYLNEYNALERNSRYKITGFTGSTGDVLVSPDKAFLFVDGRYHKQADDEVNPKFIDVYKLELSQGQRNAIAKIILDSKKDKPRIGISSSKVGLLFYKKLFEDLKDIEPEFVEFKTDIFSQSACDYNNYKIRTVPDEISGKSVFEKLDIFKNSHDADVYVLTKLEEIAYLCNLRSDEILFSSSFRAKAVFEKLQDSKSAKLIVFCCVEKILEDVKISLADSIEFKPEECFEKYILDNYSHKNLKIAFSPASINLETYRIIEKTSNILHEVEDSPVSLMKTIKNQNEIEHMKNCFEKADKAMIEAIKYANKTVKEGGRISEKDLSEKVKELYKTNGSFGLSFEVLLSSGKNTAIIHYTKPDSEKYIEKGDMVLLDCGSYFEGGYSTDATRTFLVGDEADELQKKVYTTVLKAFLNALNHPVSEATTGFDIDKAARDVIQNNLIEGFGFAHGTGHGIGLSVHEHPPSIGPSEHSKKQLLPGMCFTIEPGLYNNEWGGVRIENTVYLSDDYKIISFSKAPFDEKLVDFALLNDDEKSWFAKYQKEALQ